jgi:tRNA G18 (ribose-2'-O)-methylase SpoU
MGTVFNVPWTWVPDGYATLHSCGFTVAALALSDDSWSLADPRLQQIERLALVLGTEGDGLSPRAISEADLVVRIPMAHGVDSLNVAAASAVAFWQLRR